MNHEDLAKIAKEAGCIPRRHPEYDNDVQIFATPDVLMRFAKLIIAAELDEVGNDLMSVHRIMVQKGDVKGQGILQHCMTLLRLRGQE